MTRIAPKSLQLTLRSAMVIAGETPALTAVQYTLPMMTDGSTTLRYVGLPDDHLLHQMMIRMIETTHAMVAAEVDVEPQLSNGAGTLQGGLVATLADVVAGQAVALTLEAPSSFVTRDLSVHYLGVLAVSPVRATATVRRRSRRSAVVQVDVTDGAGALGAVATLAFAIRPLDPSRPLGH